MWLVTNNQNYDPSKFRYQINFGTRSQLQQNVDEAGQNSTLGLVLSFSAKPTTSAAFNYTSSRFSIANSQVNFYGSFFVGKGYSIEDKNYLSPSTGTLDLTIDNGKVSGTLPAMKLMDEADTTQTIDFKGEFDFNW